LESQAQSPSPSYRSLAEEERIAKGDINVPELCLRLEKRMDRSSLRYRCNRERIMQLRAQVQRQADQITSLEQWIVGSGPRPGPAIPLPLAPPERFIGAKPAGPDGDFFVRPWFDSMETWFQAQPHIRQELWLPTALSYMDHSGQVTWNKALLPALVEKHKVQRPGVPFIPTWSDFKAAMTDRFGGQASKLALAKLKANKCRYTSSMHEYSSRFRALVEKANETSDSQSVITPSEQAVHFMAGLPQLLKVFISGAAPAEGFKTLAECEHFCTLKQTVYNDLWKEQPPAAKAEAGKSPSPFHSRRARSPVRGKDRTQGSNKRHRTDKHGGASSSRPPRPAGQGDHKVHSDKPKITCAYCKKLGHHINECRNRLRHENSPAKDAAKSTPKTTEKKGF
jgi:hypothetical protein